jgi:hypothetical protein
MFESKGKGMKIKKRLRRAAVLSGLVIFTAAMTACSEDADPDRNIIIDEPSNDYETVSASSSEKFSMEDLVVNNLYMGMTEAQVKKAFGEPADYYDSKNQDIEERVYSYNELTLIFMPVGGEYKLCAAASVSETDVFARGIKIGDSKDKIFELFYRDENFMNQNLMTPDNGTIIGKYLYGSFTVENLETIHIKDKIEYGIINYNGYESLETAQSYIIEFAYFEPPYIETEASYKDDYAQIAFDIDEEGLISGIRWYYYPEMIES